MTALHPMDERPPDHREHLGISAAVTLVYADGHTAIGWCCDWTGWQRVDERGLPQECDDDAEQPLGWKELNP